MLKQLPIVGRLLPTGQVAQSEKMAIMVQMEHIRRQVVPEEEEEEVVPEAAVEAEVQADLFGSTPRRLLSEQLPRKEEQGVMEATEELEEREEPAANLLIPEEEEEEEVPVIKQLLAGREVLVLSVLPEMPVLPAQPLHRAMAQMEEMDG
ncbi:MAG: hypothetical protein U1D67_01880 [Dehalococcoidia bacterium]|nr:hypothetical protein [Dehalococcoidia bacterium]